MLFTSFMPNFYPKILKSNKKTKKEQDLEVLSYYKSFLRNYSQNMIFFANKTSPMKDSIYHHNAYSRFIKCYFELVEIKLYSADIRVRLNSFREMKHDRRWGYRDGIFLKRVSKN